MLDPIELTKMQHNLLLLLLPFRQAVDKMNGKVDDSWDVGLYETVLRTTSLQMFPYRAVLQNIMNLYKLPV
jgi:hypothetical protein